MTVVGPFFWRRIAWYVPAGVLLALLPVLKYSQLWWQLPREQKVALVFVAGAFGIACLIALFFEREQSDRAAVRALVRSLAVLGMFLLAFVVLDRDAPAYLLLPLFGCLAVVIPLSVSPLAG